MAVVLLVMFWSQSKYKNKFYKNMGELARIMFEPFTKLKRFLPIEIHHNYYSYGWWIGDKFIFFEKHWIPFIIVPMSSECHKTVFAKNGKEIKAGYVNSWDRYFEQFNE